MQPTKPFFSVKKPNTFVCAVSLFDIINDLIGNKVPGGFMTVNTYQIEINGVQGPSLKFVSSSSDADEIRNLTTLISETSFEFPNVEFDESVSYGRGCGDDDIQYVCNFLTGVVYITGSDIKDPLGSMDNT